MYLSYQVLIYRPGNVNLHYVLYQVRAVKCSRFGSILLDKYDLTCIWPAVAGL